jgi:serine/threonine-protein kinase
MNADAQKARSLFLAAVEDHAPEEWEAYLDAACARDPTLRARVEALLRAHGQANSLLDAPVPNVVATVDAPPSEGPGTVIGPYKLMEQIGEGGMGLVFVAEQQRPVRRRVALKLIKPGMDSRQVIARFEAERQALALMDHPHIAQVHDGDTTASGRPYFVMELVKGAPIPAYCDQQRLTPRQRLGLFLDVCGAVQHAHQKGILHRDLKPSNVLVAIQDGRPVPKVIDFGVAKALHQRLTDASMVTEVGQVSARWST